MGGLLFYSGRIPRSSIDSDQSKAVSFKPLMGTDTSAACHKSSRQRPDVLVPAITKRTKRKWLTKRSSPLQSKEAGHRGWNNMLRHRSFILCIAALLSSIIVLHSRGMQIYGLSNWDPFHLDPLARLSYLFYALSMLFAAYWSLSAPTHELIWLWISLPLLSLVHFCGNTLIPFFWLADSKRLYFNSVVGYFGYMVFIAVAAHLLHLLLRQKYKSSGTSNE